MTYFRTALVAHFRDMAQRALSISPADATLMATELAAAVTLLGTAVADAGTVRDLPGLARIFDNTASAIADQ